MSINNKEKQLQLLEQIILKAAQEDVEYKNRMIAEHKGQKTVGEGWMLHHLKILQKLIHDS